VTAYLLVENRHRELASRLLIAKALAERGIASVVGQQRLLVKALKDLPAGVVLMKGLDRVQTNNAVYLSRYDHTPVAIHEEAMFLADRELILADASVDGEAMAHGMLTLQHLPFNAVYAMPGQTEMYPPVMQPSVVETGNPRVDLLGMPEAWMDEAEQIRGRFGDFALINTNCASINTRHGSLAKWLEVCQQGDWLATRRKRELVMECIERDAVNMAAVRDLAVRLKKAIIRPHPAEEPESWGFLTGGKVRVVIDTAPVPWMAAASVVVHTGCTSGREAEVLGRPVYDLKPGEDAADEINAALSTENTWTHGHSGDAHQRIAEHMASMPGITRQHKINLSGIQVERGPYERAKMSASHIDVLMLYARLGGRTAVSEIGDSVFMVEAA